MVMDGIDDVLPVISRCPSFRSFLVLLADHYKMLVDGLWMKGLISGGQLDN
jgi:hypothetical protein